MAFRRILECGCELFARVHEPAIIFCSKHKVAPEMYEALKELTEGLKDEMGLAASQLDGWIKAMQALAKAEEA